jgi:two-component system, OmpR family, sensor histidine kinase BaeS
MNRLVTRMVAATILVVLVSILLIIASQGFILSRVFNNLPPDVQARFEEIRQQTLHQMSGSDASAEVQIFHSFDRVRAAFLQSTLLGLVVAGVLSFLLTWRLSRTIAKPIEKVSKAAVEVSKGNLGARANLSERELEARNEMSELGRNFNAMAASLESYESERRAMIADIAHELRTPITALELRLEALSQDLVPFEKNEVERLKKQVTLLSRLVQDLRTLSLADAGQLSLHKQRVDVKQLVQECLRTYELIAQQRDIYLRENLAAVTAKLDPERFGQILGNLLDNALRVTPSKGTIDVTLTPSHHTFSLCIADTGPGIPDADLPHIFERFVQARDTKGASTKGSSGLGLAVVQTLAQLHGGTVTASNCNTGGATFRLELPV